MYPWYLRETLYIYLNVRCILSMLQPFLLGEGGAHFVHTLFFVKVHKPIAQELNHVGSSDFACWYIDRNSLLQNCQFWSG